MGDIIDVILGVLIIAGIVYLVKRHKAKKAVRKAAKQVYKNEAKHNYLYHIVGTNYPNDKGKDVGEILNGILRKNNIEPGDELLVPGSISNTTFDGEPALKVMIGSKHIGWIKRDDIADVYDMLMKHPCNVQIKLNQKRVTLMDGDTAHVMGGDVFADAIITY